MLAEEMGVGHTTVQRVWKERDLKLHLTRTFKLPNDPRFAEKVVDVVGLYLDRPTMRGFCRLTRRASSRHTTLFAALVGRHLLLAKLRRPTSTPRPALARRSTKAAFRATM